MLVLNALNFVKGAVSLKDYEPALKHFRIANGRVLGYNGTIALSAPIDLDISATPKAVPFVKAIERCTAAQTIVHRTPGGHLGIKSGKFRVEIECLETEILDRVYPEGVPVELHGSFIDALKALTPFIGTDASRPWAMGILLRGQSAFATNNIILAEYWLGTHMPEVNIPVDAVEELIRIGEDPIGVLLGTNSITFYFVKERWMRAQLLSLEWPPIGDLLDRVGTGNLQPIPEGFYDAIETISPFVDRDTGRVYFRAGMVCTKPQGEGASVEIEGLPDHGAFYYKYLLSLQGRANRIDFSCHPDPCPFQGEKLRGVIQGMHDE